MEVAIIIGKTDFQFYSKEDSRFCEVVNTKTKEEWKGFITQLKSNGTYIVELQERIEGN